jgi:hypothetical protein
VEKKKYIVGSKRNEENGRRR